MSYSNTTGLPAPSDILRPWIASDYFTEESRERGNAVHEACADHLRGSFAWIDRKWRGYFDSFKRWCDLERPAPVASAAIGLLVEKRLISKRYGYSGQPDLPGYVDSRGGALGVVDFKTSAALGRAWPIQIAAYQGLVGNEMSQPCLWGCSVRLKEDGSYPLVNFYEDFERHFNLFLGALNLHRHFAGK